MCCSITRWRSSEWQCCWRCTEVAVGQLKEFGGRPSSAGLDRIRERLQSSIPRRRHEGKNTKGAEANQNWLLTCSVENLAIQHKRIMMLWVSTLSITSRLREASLRPITLDPK